MRLKLADCFIPEKQEELPSHCWICASGNHIDGHHVDCLRGQLSSETVLLCRRCHQTYHTWGVGAFSPDTTGKSVELENKRREILRSLPAGHPQRRRAEYLGEIQPLKLEDVRRSGYWYRKWGIKLPPKERALRAERVPFRLPMAPPLCGEEWLSQHMRDFTTEDIAALAIEIACDGKTVSASLADKRGTVKKAVICLR